MNSRKEHRPTLFASPVIGHWQVRDVDAVWDYGNVRFQPERPQVFGLLPRRRVENRSRIEIVPLPKAPDRPLLPSVVPSGPRLKHAVGADDAWTPSGLAPAERGQGGVRPDGVGMNKIRIRSEEHTSELQSLRH